MKSTLAEREQLLQAKQKEVDALLAGTPGALEFHEQQTYWQRTRNRHRRVTPDNCSPGPMRRNRHFSSWNRSSPTWSATLEQNKATPDLGPVLDVIRQSVSDIQQLKIKAQNQLRTIVNLQVQAAGHRTRSRLRS